MNEELTKEINSESKVSEDEELHNKDITSKLGELMLQGWQMLPSSCHNPSMISFNFIIFS